MKPFEIGAATPSNEEFIDLVETAVYSTDSFQPSHTSVGFRASMSEVNIVLEYLRATEEESLAFAAVAMTQGGLIAREMARRVFNSVLNAGAVMVALNGQEALWAEQRLTGPYIRQKVLAAWSTGAVMEESGIEPEGAMPTRVRAAVQLAVTGSLSSNQDAADALPQYRGASVMALISAISEASSDSAEWPSFIEWAGHHEDIATVVNVGVEYKTVNADALKAIIANQSQLQPALRQGTL